MKAPADPMDAGKSPSRWWPNDAAGAAFDLAGPLGGAVTRLLTHRWALIVLLAAIGLRIVQGGWFGADVSWLMTLGQTYLAGHSPYQVFVEVNPPGSILLYLPTVFIGHVLALAPETILNVLLLGTGAASVFLCTKLVARTGVLTVRQTRLFEAIAMFIVLIAPCEEFGQREHIAAIALLPAVALYALRVAGGRPRLATQIVAGIGAGIGISIKPHFALALALPFAYLLFSRPMMLRARLRLALMPEHLLAVAVMAAYLLAALAWFPDYFSHALPLALRVYEPVLVSPEGLTDGLALMAIEAALMAALVRRRMLERVPVIFGLAAAGFGLAMVLQFKGWPYHSLPALMLLNLTFVLNILPRTAELEAAARRPANRTTAIMLATLGIALAAGQFHLAVSDDDVAPGLRQALVRLAPPQPKLLSISLGSIGFPLVRQLDGQWVGPTANAWIPEYAYHLLTYPLAPAARRAIAGDASWYWRATAARIRTAHPDAVLIESKMLAAWTFAQPALVQALRGYRKAETVGRVAIWIPRKDPDGSASRSPKR